MDYPDRSSGKYSDLLGVSELVLRWGVSRARAGQLTQQDRFPPPVVRLKMGPAWHIDHVRLFEKATGRSADEEWRRHLDVSE